jgi:hypothetical protein
VAATGFLLLVEVAAIALLVLWWPLKVAVAAARQKVAQRAAETAVGVKQEGRLLLSQHRVLGVFHLVEAEAEHHR